MPQFSYKAVGRDGKGREGVIESFTESGVSARVKFGAERRTLRLTSLRAERPRPVAADAADLNAAIAALAVELARLVRIIADDAGDRRRE